MIMKKTLLLQCLLAITLVSCNNANQAPKTANDTPPIQVETQDVNAFIKTTILSHYMKEFNAHNTDTPPMKMAVDSNHQDKEFAFLNGIELKEINPEDSSSGAINVIPQPKDYIKGDLNGDKLDDYVVPVYATGGGTAEWREIFVFVSRNGKLEYSKMYSSFELAHCTEKGSHGGQFYPENIVNSILVGQSDCYKESDPHCCPSIKAIVEYKFNDSLTFFKQTTKHSPPP